MSNKKLLESLESAVLYWKVLKKVGSISESYIDGHITWIEARTAFWKEESAFNYWDAKENYRKLIDLGFDVHVMETMIEEMS